jgi:ABC-type nitrate/sulfonate/bicarbonate transport system ATPase subunit
MSNTAVHFSGVTFGFGKQTPLFRDLSCSLTADRAAGKIVALMGPSGVGKTTFCELALGIQRPQKGTVTFVPDDANIGAIPQKAVMFDELSVRENITCLKYSKTLGPTFRDDKAEHAIKSLNLSGVLLSATRAAALSGGEAQRVMLARIQSIRCDVLILDEPCSFLDNRVKDTFLSALRAIVDESRLLALMVTHVWDEVRLVADDVAFLHQMNGSPVTLHVASVTEAIDYPPTVDALFGIHWPNCAVLSRSEITALPRELANCIPQEAGFIGLFHKAPNQSRNDGLAGNLWAHLAASSPSVANTLAPRRDCLEPKSVQCVFYGHDGVALQTRPVSTAGRGHIEAPR